MGVNPVVLTPRVLSRTASATREKAVAAAGLDPTAIMLLNSGDRAFANGDFAAATARYAESVAVGQSQPDSKPARSGAAGSTRRRPATASQAAFFGGSNSAGGGLHLLDPSACAVCGESPQVSAWVVCSECRSARYCSEACRRSAWEWGHSRSCCGGAGTPPPPPTPATVHAGGRLRQPLMRPPHPRLLPLLSVQVAHLSPRFHTEHSFFWVLFGRKGDHF